MTTHRVHRIPQGLPAALQARLRTFGALLKLRDLTADVALLIVVTGAMLIAGCAFDRFVDVPGSWRLPYSIAVGIVALLLALRCIYRLFRRADYDGLAHNLDAASGDARGSLRSLVDFCRRGLPMEAFAGLSASRAEAVWKNRSVAGLVDRRPLRWAAIAALLAIVIAGLTQIEAVRADLLLTRFLDPMGNYMRPTATWFEVEPPPAAALRGGDEYIVRARLRGRPAPGGIPLLRATPAGAESTVSLMKSRDDVWEFPLTQAGGDVEFALSLGAARSALYRVSFTPRPAIEKISVSYQFPKYTRLPDRQETLTGRTITALEDTRVRLEFVANVPLQSLAGLIEKEQHQFTIDQKDPRKARWFHTITGNERIELQLHARNGLENNKEPPLNFRAIPDAPPAVMITNDPGSRALFPNEALAVAFKATDDIGLSEVALVNAGDFSQEAELDKSDLKEASGIISAPIASLVNPGVSSVVIRVTALDSKGQRTFSPPVTIRIASNSYERQLRLALRSFTARDRSGDPSNAERMGFPVLERNAKRLKDLRTLNAKIATLLGLLPENGKLGPDELKRLNEAGGIVSGLGPVFPYLCPPLLAGFGQVRAFDLLGHAPMTMRLQRIVRDAICGSELAISPEALLAEFRAALDSPDAKGALEQLQKNLEAAAARQDLVSKKLESEYNTVLLELAGCLATNLDLTLRQAGAEGLRDRDTLVAAMGRLKELAGLLSSLPLSAVDDFGEEKKVFEHALKAGGDAEALSVAAPALKDTIERIKTAALKQPDDEIPTDDFLRVQAPHPGPDWSAVYALWLDIQIDDEDADEATLLQHALRQLRMAGSGELVPPKTDEFNTPDANALRIFANLSRFAAQAATLRVNLATGQTAPGQPDFEPCWLRLREYLFELRKLQAAAAGTGLDAAKLSAFVAQLAPLNGWLPPAELSAALPQTLSEWEDEARAMSMLVLPKARSGLQASMAAAGGWDSGFFAALDRYRRDIAGQIAALEKSKTPETTYAALPIMSERLSLLETAALKMIDIGEAGRLLSAPEANGALDLDRLAAIRVVLRKAQEQLGEVVGAQMSTASKGSALEADAWKGKVEGWREHDQIISSIADIVAPDAKPDAKTACLDKYTIKHRFNLEHTTIDSAIDIATRPAERTPALLGSSASVAAPTFWGEIVYVAEALRQALVKNNAQDADRRWSQLREMLAQVTTLPREAQGLSAVQTLSPEKSREHRTTQEWDGIVDELRPLAKPPAVFPDEERRQQQSMAVWRARFQLAISPTAAPVRTALEWAVCDQEWSRRKHELAGREVSPPGLAGGAQADDFCPNLPAYLYQELKRAREGVMPELYKQRAHRYLGAIMEKSR